MKRLKISRRRFLGGAALAALSAAGLPVRVSFAEVPTDRRLLVVNLRGGLDGLAAVIPYGDRDYHRARKGLAMPETGEAMKDLDGHFALHSALAPLGQVYEAGELLVMHATASPYRGRSHFDAQDVLESGAGQPHDLATGWLNRAATVLQPEPPAIAIGPSVPLLLRGDAPVGSWAPSLLPPADEDFVTRVMQMYESDPLLHESLAEARRLRVDTPMSGAAVRGRTAVVGRLRRAADFLRAPDGPRLAAIDMGGWDTHANQGRESGRLAGNLRLLADGLTGFREGMGDLWPSTAVLVITEFGRTVAANGSNGTDHGTAGISLLLGGSVNGGRVVGDWPGLANLYEGRDLAPANDLRGLLKATLQQHLGIEEALLADVVFPDSRVVAPMAGLMHG